MARTYAIHVICHVARQTNWHVAHVAAKTSKGADVLTSRQFLKRQRRYSRTCNAVTTVTHVEPTEGLNQISMKPQKQTLFCKQHKMNNTTTQHTTNAGPGGIGNQPIAPSASPAAIIPTGQKGFQGSSLADTNTIITRGVHLKQSLNRSKSQL